MDTSIIVVYPGLSLLLWDALLESKIKCNTMLNVREGGVAWETITGRWRRGRCGL